ncbi:MAG: dihydroorotate dehydrogenase electron transfer subunit [Firmicutes bacterium]|nr:dihydroorotate dehydrogenase electron transfer subunit [Bacillota bacterium]
MRNDIATIITNERIAAGTYEMVLQMPQNEEVCQAFGQIRPGQFINLKLEDHYLRRPISICDWDQERQALTIIYKVVGIGTETMSRMSHGEALDLLWPLGNGYDLTAAADCRRPLLIGGGAGVPPMFGLCRRLIEASTEKPTVILGFRSEEEGFYREHFEKMGAQTIIMTEDGSTGEKGFVTDAMKALEAEEGKEYCDSFFACGPEAMLRAVDEAAPEGIPGFMSFEERMGCGFGACMGCSCKTKYGNKRICKDGPVLERREILW